MLASTPTSLMISDTPRISYVKYSTGANKTTRTVYRAVRKPDLTVARQGVRSTERGTITRTTKRTVFLRASAISRLQALFSPPSFLLREKRWCRRRHPASSGCGLPRLRRGGRTEASAPTSLCKEARAFRAFGAVLRPPGAMGCHPGGGDGSAPSGHKINSPPGGPP